MEAVPTQFIELVEILLAAMALLLPTIGVTDLFKRLASAIDAQPFAGGTGARVVSWVVAALMTATGLGLGWIHFDSTGGLLALWSLTAALANYVYKRIYATES